MTKRDSRIPHATGRRRIAASAAGPALALLLTGGCGPSSAPASPRDADAPRPGGTTDDAAASAADTRPRIVAVLAYHDAYPWQEGIRTGLEERLANRAALELIRLDAKRRPDPAWIEDVSDRAADRILAARPDVVITADDITTLELSRRLAGTGIPIAFCGISWPADADELPRLGTGMVQCSPVDELLDTAREAVPMLERVVYLGGDRLTDRIMAEAYRRAARARRLELDVRLVSGFGAWTRAVAEAGPRTAVIVANHAGIADWDDAAARDAVSRPGGLLLADRKWMAPLAMITVATSGREQGAWAAEAALAIAAGTDPTSIPIVPNVRFEHMVNRSLADAGGIELPDSFLRTSIEVQP